MSSSGPKWEEHQKRVEEQQKKVFTNWVNTYLEKRGLKIENIKEDFKDGILLINLIEVLSDSALGKYDKKPKFDIQRVQNLNVALNYVNQFIAGAGIKISFSAEDILEGNIKLILGMIWVLIHKFSIQDISEEEMSAKEGLLLWCKKKTEGYEGVHVQNFSDSWQDGLAFNAIIHKHRPNLVDFASLKKEDRVANLENAFNVAHEHLGIPKLLDAEDIASIKPDEKIIMTYVAYFWKLFAASQKNEIAAKRVSKTLSRLESNEKMAKDYCDRAEKLVNWISEKTEEFAKGEYGSTLDEIHKKVSEFSDYKTTDKPQQTAEKLELTTVLGNLQTKQKAEKSPIFSPPEGLEPTVIDEKWEKLTEVEKVYDTGLRDALQRGKMIDFLERKFNVKIEKLNQWLSEKKRYVEDRNYGESVHIAQAKLKVHEAFEEELGVMRSRLDAVSATLKELNELSSDENRTAKEQAVQESWKELEVAAQEKRKSLEEHLKSLEDMEYVCLTFSKKAEGFSLWLDDTLLFLNDPLSANNIEEAEEASRYFQEFKKTISAKEEEYNELMDLAKKVEESSLGSNPFSRFSAEEIRNKWNESQSALAKREEEIKQMQQLQNENDNAKQEYANKVKELLSLADSVKAEVSKDTAPLQEQLETVKQNALRLSNMKEIVEAAEALSNKLLSQSITENRYTSVAVQELRIEVSQLEKFITEKRSLLEEKILAEESSHITPEQAKELRESFNFFDKDHSGALNKPEFRNCLESLGQDLSEEEFEKVFAELDKNKEGTIQFAEFTDFMTKQVQETDTYEDVLAAFKTLANDKEFITEEELREVMSEEQVEYLKTQMPLVDGGFDYKKFADSIFT